MKACKSQIAEANVIVKNQTDAAIKLEVESANNTTVI